MIPSPNDLKSGGPYIKQDLCMRLKARLEAKAEIKAHKSEGYKTLSRHKTDPRLKLEVCRMQRLERLDQRLPRLKNKATQWTGLNGLINIVK